MVDFLEAHRRTSAARAARLDGAAVRRRAALAADPRPLSLSPEGFDVVAEVKRVSPADGPLDPEDGSVAERTLRYATGGAAAISVLTEPDRFRGSLADLREAVGIGAVPVMRKDFLVDPVQVFEARAEGADGVLLIARMVDRAALDRLVDAAAACRMFVLVEAFGADDLAVAAAAAERARDAGATALVGVNARDLRTLAVDLDRFGSLSANLPAGIPAVAESGLANPVDAARAALLGYRAALVGSSLMRAAEPDALVRAMVDAGRGAIAGKEGRPCASS